MYASPIIHTPLANRFFLFIIDFGSFQGSGSSLAAAVEMSPPALIEIRSGTYFVVVLELRSGILMWRGVHVLCTLCP